MTALVKILSHLIAQPARASRELPKGLWLVYYPPAGEDTHRLIIGRQHVEPSVAEGATVRAALLVALDALDGRVADLAHDWTSVSDHPWHGAQIAWTLIPAADAFHPDPDRAAHFRRLAEQRQARIDARNDRNDRRTRNSARPQPKTLF